MSLIGYENRLLADQDFADDRKDAGDIGSGHTVTALYELVPVGAPSPVSSTSPARRYQQPARRAGQAATDELLFLKIRSKAPDGRKSVARSFVVRDRPVSLARTSDAFRFSAAVAQYGMLLRGSPALGRASFDSTRALARGALGADRHGARAQLVELVELAERLRARRDARESWRREWERRWSKSSAVRRASVIQPEAFPVIERAAATLREFPTIRIEISGHSDDREGRSADESFAISHARAETVRAFLIERHGVDPARVSTRAAGADEPVATNKTREGRAKNRRIEFTILSQ